MCILISDAFFSLAQQGHLDGCVRRTDNIEREWEREFPGSVLLFHGI
jgi:hypothetical protein